MRLLICMLFLLASSAFADAAAILSAENSQIRLPMPGRDVTSGYMTLHNHSDKTVTVVAVSSPLFSRVELHQHSHHNGMMRMEKMKSVTVDAGSALRFSPGGMHLMLFSAETDLTIDQQIPVVFHLADEQQITLTFPIVAMPKR